jgi:Spy/CpxP family protein refolding chaperone
MVHNPRTWQRCVTAMSLFRERSTQRVLSVCVTFCAMAAAIVATQGVLAAPQRWWRDQAIQQNLRLTAEQVRQFDSLFERDVPARIALQQQIAQLDRELLRAIELEADVAVVMRLSDEVELLRAQRNVRRALMLVAMRKTLTSDQRAKLFKLPRSSSAAVAH